MGFCAIEPADAHTIATKAINTGLIMRLAIDVELQIVLLAGVRCKLFLRGIWGYSSAPQIALPNFVTTSKLYYV